MVEIKRAANFLLKLLKPLSGHIWYVSFFSAIPMIIVFANERNKNACY